MTNTPRTSKTERTTRPCPTCQAPLDRVTRSYRPWGGDGPGLSVFYRCSSGDRTHHAPSGRGMK